MTSVELFTSNSLLGSTTSTSLPRPPSPPGASEFVSNGLLSGPSSVLFGSTRDADANITRQLGETQDFDSEYLRDGISDHITKYRYIDNIPIDDDFLSTGLLGNPPNFNHGMSNPKNLHTCK